MPQHTTSERRKNRRNTTRLAGNVAGKGKAPGKLGTFGIDPKQLDKLKSLFGLGSKKK